MASPVDKNNDETGMTRLTRSRSATTPSACPSSSLTMTLPHVTPLASNSSSDDDNTNNNEGSPVLRRDANDDSLMATTTPSQVLARIGDTRFPYRLLGMLWYVERTAAYHDNNPSAWIRWSRDGKTFLLPPQSQAQDGEFQNLLKGFFDKRLDLILRSLREWDFDLGTLGASEPIQCQHPLVYRGMLDNIDSFAKIQFKFHGHDRHRVKCSNILKAAPKRVKATPSQKASSKTKVVPVPKQKTKSSAKVNLKKTPKATRKTAPKQVKEKGSGSGTRKVHSSKHSKSSVASLAAVPSLPRHEGSAVSEAVHRSNPVTVPGQVGKKKTQITVKRLLHFPFMMAQLLQELDVNQLDTVMHWDPTGTGVMLRPQSSKLSAKEVNRLRPYIGSPKIKNFTRQFERYGFRKTRCDNGWNLYSHPLFQRGELVPEKLVQVVPLRNATTKATAVVEKSDPPKKHPPQTMNSPTPKSTPATGTAGSTASDTNTPRSATAMSRHSSPSLMDLIFAFDLEEAAATIAATENMEDDNKTGETMQSYLTPEKDDFPSTGLTPLAQRIHPTSSTPGFDSIGSLPPTPPGGRLF